MKEQLEIINRIIQNDKASNSVPRYIIQAIYYTIDVNALMNLFIKTDNANLQASLKKHLPRRLRDKSINLKKVFSNLMRKMKKATYVQHQRIRFLLSRFITELPQTYVQKYYDYFSSTGYTHDLSAALNVSHLVWNSRFDQTYIDKYFETGNNKYLDAVLKYGNAESVINNIDLIWEDDDCPNYVKTRIIRAIATTSLDKLEFLKRKEPDKYLYALSMACSEVGDKEATELYDRLDANQKFFGLWCLGKLGKWDLLKEYIKNYLR